MTAAPPSSNQPAQPVNYRRGDIWMVDFGNPVGTELGMEHPAVIVSKQEFNNLAQSIGRVIVVPGTSTRFVNSRGNTLLSHQEVPASGSNGLQHTTYFMAEQVRSVSIARFRRVVGAMENAHVRDIEDRLCLVMDLFK